MQKILSVSTVYCIYHKRITVNAKLHEIKKEKKYIYIKKGARGKNIELW